MEELIKIFIGFFTKEPSFIIKYLFKSMRIILLLLISASIYKRSICDFTIIGNIEELYSFFITGHFLLPLLFFTVTVLVFDLLLKSVIQLIEHYIFLKKINRVIGEINLFLINNKDKADTIKRFSSFLTYKLFVKIYGFFKKEVSKKDILNVFIDIEKVNEKKYDNAILVVCQLLIFMLFVYKENTLLISLFFLLIPISAIIKGYLLLAKRVIAIVKK